jgi:hypothetical protein
MNIEILSLPAGARRFLGNLRRLFRYLVQPKTTDPEYFAGERVLWAPVAYGLVQHVLPFAVNAAQWAKSLAQQLIQFTKRARGGAQLPKHVALHLCLSFPADDAPALGRTAKIRAKRMRQIVRAALRLAALEGRPYVVVAHGDRPHLHAHVVVALVNYAGVLWKDSQSKLRFSEIAATLERRFRLRRTPHPSRSAPAPRPARRNPPRGQIFHARRLGITPAHVELQEAIDAAMLEAQDAEDFVQALSRRRVGIRLRLRGEAVEGISYGLHTREPGYAAKASKLGSLYGRAELDRRYGLAALRHVVRGGSFIGKRSWDVQRGAIQKVLDEALMPPPVAMQQGSTLFPAPSPFRGGPR